MIRNHRLIALTLAAFATAAAGRAALAQAPAAAPATLPAAAAAVNGADATAVAPFVNELTFLVVRVDVTRTDLTKFNDWFIAALRADKTDPQQAGELVVEQQRGMAEVNKFVAAFRAAGGREIVWTIGTDDFRHGPVGVVTGGAGVDLKAIAQVFNRTTNGFVRTAELGGGLVFGDQRVVAKARAMKAAERPELAAALAAAGDAPARAAFIPTPALKTMITTAVPMLPEALGGGATLPLAQGVQWAAAGAALPPGSSLDVLVQAADAEKAAHVKQVLEKAMDWAASQSDKAPVKFDPADVQRLRAALAPKQDGPRVTIALAKDAADRAVTGALIPAAIGARASAMQVQSASNLRQILVACHMFAAENKGATPDKLEDLRKQLGAGADWVMSNPRDRRRKPGYVYLKPLTDFARAGRDHVIAYEAHDAWPAGGVNVGFADGHVELIREQPQFKRLLTATEEDNQGGM